ncbi:MAG: helix-turn-helix domain-containing protein [Oscillospiraceae bacterium]|nr:helix-turn-helix domain-containing protein [Oscillospiraceae bacterium]
MTHRAPYYRKEFSDYPDMLSAAQAAQMLQVGKNTIYRLVSAKKLDSILIHGSHHITKNSVIKFLRSNPQTDL